MNIGHAWELLRNRLLLYEYQKQDNPNQTEIAIIEVLYDLRDRIKELEAE